MFVRIGERTADGLLGVEAELHAGMTVGAAEVHRELQLLALADGVAELAIGRQVSVEPRLAAARELRGATLRAVLVTGDTSSAVRELKVDENLRITSKPINSSELLSLVKTLLAG